MPGSFTRRAFISAVGLSPLFSSAFTETKQGDGTDANPFTVLFQGDSITDGNRGRTPDPNHIMGHGYAFSVASQLGAAYPERNLTFINKGTSGDTISLLEQRWSEDTLNYKPQVLSLLAGINDVLFRIRNGKTTETSAFESSYRQLLETTRAAIPDVKLIIGEPFILPVGMVIENPSQWKQEVDRIQLSVRTLAAEFNGIFIPYQAAFTKALKKAPAEYWIWDGIHPTVAGHGLMANEWLTHAGKVIPKLKR